MEFELARSPRRITHVEPDNPVNAGIGVEQRQQALAEESRDPGHDDDLARGALVFARGILLDHGP